MDFELSLWVFIYSLAGSLSALALGKIVRTAIKRRRARGSKFSINLSSRDRSDNAS